MKRETLIKYILLGMFCIASFQTRAQMIVLRNDLLKDAAATPNLGVDFVIGNKQTLGIEAFYNQNPWGKEIKMMGLSPQFRYWFGGRPFTRQFVGHYMLVASYDLQWKSDVYKGNAAAAGISFGHVINLTNRLNLELCAGVGLLGYKQKQYKEGDNYSDYGERTNTWGSTLFPRIGIALSYIIK